MALLGGSLANHSALYVGPLRRAGITDRRVAAVTMVATALLLAMRQSRVLLPVALNETWPGGFARLRLETLK